MIKQDELSASSALAFLQAHRLGVIASASLEGIPEAALVNFAVTSDLEIVFETTTATRKFPNLKHNPRADMVVGWANGQTLQCSGAIDEPEGRDGERLRAFYVAAFPSSASHAHWPGNSYFRLRPFWLRLSDYNPPRRILELRLPGNRSAEEHQSWVRSLLS